MNKVESSLVGFAAATLLGAASCTAAARSESRTEPVQNALSAAPRSLAEGATVVDHQNNVVRQGTNGWVCMPDNPEVPNNTPMCLDQRWQEFIAALMHRREPKFSGIGVGYMLQEDMPVSNIDPFATGPTSDNQWVPNAGPHIMVIVSDPNLLDGLSTDPNNGGPWVMWKGTPYAHLMIPTAGRNE